MGEGKVFKSIGMSVRPMRERVRGSIQKSVFEFLARTFEIGSGARLEAVEGALFGCLRTSPSGFYLGDYYTRFRPHEIRVGTIILRKPAVHGDLHRHLKKSL